VTLLVALAISTGGSVAAPPPEKQIATLKRQIATLKRTLAIRTDQRDKAQIRALEALGERDTARRQAKKLAGEIADIRTERDAARADVTALQAEVTRLRGLVVSDVHTLANAWRQDGNAKTEVSYYTSSSDYWSYTFTYCGFC
jgi:chromosome segregation ATPase